jgi:hypothetical protein
MGMTVENLAAAHAVLDAKRLTMVNRTVVRWLYDAVYPDASETPATIKLRSILKTPEMTKIRMGQKLTTESVWADQNWQKGERRGRGRERGRERDGGREGGGAQPQASSLATEKKCAGAGQRRVQRRKEEIGSAFWHQPQWRCSHTCFLETGGYANTSTENPANTGSHKPRRLVVFHSICPPLSSSPHALLYHSYGLGSCHSHQ